MPFIILRNVPMMDIEVSTLSRVKVVIMEGGWAMVEGTDGLTANDDVCAPARYCVQHRAVIVLVTFLSTDHD